MIRLRPRELALLSAPAPGEDDLAEFYVRFNKVKDFHRQNTNINARTFLNEIDELVRSDGLQTVYVEDEEEPIIIDPLDSVFSGEEAYGKRMDLYQAHSLYLNLRGANRLSYVAFLDMLRRGYVEKTLDMKERGSNAYLEYVQTIYTYLLSFFDRALPLVNVQAKLQEEEETFAMAWEAGTIQGWQRGSARDEVPVEGIWCEYCEFFDVFQGYLFVLPGCRVGLHSRKACWRLLCRDKHAMPLGYRRPSSRTNEQVKSHTRNKQYTTPTSPRPSTRKRSPLAKRPPTLIQLPLPHHHRRLPRTS